MLADTYTAQAMIMTDRDNNQITAFHPGAMMQAHSQRIEAAPGVQLWASSPPMGAMPCCSTPSNAARQAFRLCSIGPGPADVQWRGVGGVRRAGLIGSR